MEEEEKKNLNKKKPSFEISTAFDIGFEEDWTVLSVVAVLLIRNKIDLIKYILRSN